jgi:hypothetical protein
MKNSMNPTHLRRMAMAAALAALSGHAQAVTTTVRAEYIFSDMRLTVADLDPSDAYLPTLTPRANGSFNNTGSASAMWRGETDWQDTKESIWTNPLPAGGLLSVDNVHAELNGSFASVLAEPDRLGTRITLRSEVTDPAPGQYKSGGASVAFAPTSPGGTAPAYSFTLGAMSQATFSMQVEGGWVGTGLGEPIAAGNGFGTWELTMKQNNGGPDAQTVTGSDAFGLEVTGQPDQSSSKQVSYSISNAGTQAMDVALYFRADAQAWAIKPPVPEPETWAMVLAGMALVGARGLKRTRANRPA